jgi:hypothetical protein
MSLKLLPIALFISFVTTLWHQSHAELVWVEKAILVVKRGTEVLDFRLVAAVTWVWALQFHS